MEGNYIETIMGKIRDYIIPGSSKRNKPNYNEVWELIQEWHEARIKQLEAEKEEWKDTSIKLNDKREEHLKENQRLREAKESVWKYLKEMHLTQQPMDEIDVIWDEILQKALKGEE